MSESVQTPKRKPPNRGVRGGTLDREKITVRVTREQRARIAARADAAGMTLASYGRVSMLGNSAGLRSVPRPPIDRAAAERVLVMVPRIGGNLYQLSKRANFGEPVLAGEVAETVTDIRAMLDELRIMLGRKPLGAPPQP